ncbi:tetratricopeptide repeat protein [Hansschlegelia zhihuaiae]|uniref:Tetratricopeptide repeat protein n=1 Tax=Hansschlegelia zhihuaiae TaxID=405005 RepID=A0A4Q0ML96_9HYPH|nr:tetratricopeptide repeat protein [Hansschlegelia zhihuaiae]RXF74460.1 hypothetical protein EK403_06540 [Hansschlegelia zhihuaiae]
MSISNAVPLAVCSDQAFSSLDPLSQLAIWHGTDKYGEHFYTPHYHRHFEALRDRPVTLLEAGIGGYDDPEAGGESLAMWRDYFPSGRIIGIDIAPKRLDLGSRVEIRQGSMSDGHFLETLNAEFGPFDIVIDDGSHVSADTIGFFEASFPFVADGGFFAIEDTQTSYWPAFAGGLSPSRRTTMNFVKALMDEVDHAERAWAPDAPRPHPFAASIHAIHRFHNLVLIEKGSNTETSNFARPTSRAADPARQAALAAFRALLESGAGSEAAALACARMTLESGDAEEALRRIEASLAQFPDSRRLLLLGARIALDLGRVDEAAAHARRSMRHGRLDAEVFIAASSQLRQRFPDLAADVEGAAGGPDADAGVCLQAARVLESLKIRERALHWLKAAASRLQAQHSHLLNDLTDAFRRLGEPLEALAHSQGSTSQPPFPARLLRHGALLRAAGRLEEAEDALSEAVALDWRQPRAHAERSRTLAAMGRHSEAFEAAKAVLASAPRSRAGEGAP